MVNIVLKNTKKGLSLASGASAVLLIVIIAITAVVGVRINTQLQSGYSAGDAVYDAAQNSTLGIGQITSQMTLVGLIIVMSIVIGLLWSSFGGMVAGRM